MTELVEFFAPDAPVLPKLYIVTHAHLSAGYQIAQVAHAVTEFIFAFPNQARKWNRESNVVVVLEAASALELEELVHKATQQGIGAAPFREPDLDGELTAVAFCPGDETTQLLVNYPLAGENLGNQDVLRAREQQARDPFPPDALFSL